MVDRTVAGHLWEYAEQHERFQGAVWVNTNLSRSAAEEGMRVLLERLDEPGVRVLRAGDDIDTPE